jgi:hypothetical protein
LGLRVSAVFEAKSRAPQMLREEISQSDPG